MVNEPKHRDVMLVLVALAAGALLFGAGAVVAVGVSGGGGMMSMMGSGMMGGMSDDIHMMGEMEQMHEDWHAMMDEHHRRNATSPA